MDLVDEIKARFKSAQASLVPMRGVGGFAGGYALGYHDALGELLEYMREKSAPQIRTSQHAEQLMTKTTIELDIPRTAAERIAVEDDRALWVSAARIAEIAEPDDPHARTELMQAIVDLAKTRGPPGDRA